MLGCAVRLDGVRASFARTNAQNFLNRRDKNLPVPDPARSSCLLDRFYSSFDEGIVQDHFQLHLRQEVDHILGPPIEFRMTLLPTEAFGFGDSDPLDANFL